MGTLSIDERTALALRAATVYERVEAWKRRPARSAGDAGDEPGTGAADEALRSWNRAFSPGDPEMFARRLEWDYLDPETVRRALAQTPAGDLDASALGWTTWIHRIVDEAARQRGEDGTAASPHFAAGEEPPFFELLLPILNAARTALADAAPGVLDDLIPGARPQLERPLLRSAGLVSELALLEDFKRFAASRPDAAPASEAHAGGALQSVAVAASVQPGVSCRTYRAFVADMLGRRLVSFYLSYPVLARHVAVLAGHWVDTTLEMLRRLRTDRPALAAMFGAGRDPGRIASIQAAKSDPHDGGRRVSIVDFESGLRVVYKPRDVGLERAFNGFLSWMAGAGLAQAPGSLKVLERDGYGWVEFARHATFADRGAAGRYYERAGALMCLMHVLRGRDLHMENVVATAEGPAAIDVELLFQPARRLEDPGETAPARGSRPGGDDSCLDTGLLSFLQMGPDGEVYDIGALRGRRDAAISRPRRVWKDKRLDTIHFVDERQSDLEAASDVRLADRVERPEDYATEIAAGFAAACRFLMAHRQELLAPDGPLAAFAGRNARVVLRATDNYATLIHLLASPPYQAEGVARSGAIDVLNRVFSRARSRPAIWGLAVEERRALDRLDIPRLTVPIGETHVYAGGRRVAERFFVRSGFDEVTARIGALSEESLDIQLWLLRRGLSQSVNSRLQSDLVRLDLGPGSPAGTSSPVELLAYALWIAGELESRSVAEADGLTWHTAPPTVRRPPVREHNLYEGSAGPALFFAALAAVTGDERWRTVARDAAQPLAMAIERESPDDFARDADIGGCSGLGSIVYALTWIGRLIGDPRMTELAGRVALSITDARITADRLLDVVGGAAGAILGVLPAWHDLQDPRLLRAADRCGEHLLATQVAVEGASAWPSGDNRFYSGFGHGAAGVAHALVRLYGETGRRAFLEAALRAHAFERSLFVRVHRNWAIALPDDRLGVDGIGMTAWCHGAPGIALARLSLLDIVDDPVFFSQITAAIGTTGGAPGHGSDHLCCGNMGRIEALVMVGRRLNDDDAVAAGQKIVDRVAARAAAKRHFRLTAGGFEYPVFHPGFFRGLSGIGYQFLRLVAGSALPSVLAFQDAAANGGEKS